LEFWRTEKTVHKIMTKEEHPMLRHSPWHIVFYKLQWDTLITIEV